MDWLQSIKTAGAWVLSTAQLLVHLLYVISTPLRWPLYYVYASILFLLSPIWALLKLGLGVISFATALAAKLKYFYVYFTCAAIIGACAGFILHGTSSFIFVLLGIDAASERRRLRDEQHYKSPHAPESSLDEVVDVGYEKGSNPNVIGWRFDRRHHITKKDSSDLLEKEGRFLLTREQPRSRRRGLLEQTIHEESSESDFL